ncbi:MAG: nucleotidyl transferase AbiEii/AbiGii toxin family protein [Firmicutes bacterium]|nr:nucleotidyl transferase AbiEii/AbiGii toxin family protein [Bacillota bacterium]
MKLHTYPEEFRELIVVVADENHISESAVERDYYIVMMLKALADSPYAEQCVFKGGTSLSKCYPGSIDRFSEDIDLTFLGMELSDKACDKAIKKIESVMSEGAQTEKIAEERSNRSKSMYVKRHAICGTLGRKVRHIYDVARLYQMPEIQAFLAETSELKRLVRLTKDTDSYYMEKRNISAAYDPAGAYDFASWQQYFDSGIRSTYESLHTRLLYTDEKQDFDVAVKTFEQISSKLAEIGE